jgi:zinc/manganese transport system substrate-binding protein
MKKTLLAALVSLVLLATARVRAEVAVVATTPDLASVARAVGGNRVKVIAMSLPTQDPHWVDAKPSLALALAKSDLLVLTGAELEIGWLPALLTGSRNGNIQPGARGYLDASTFVDLLEVPTGKIDRSMGDIHASGNPHYMLDPRRVERVAVGIGKRLADIDPEGRGAYLEGTRRFVAELRAARARWEKTLAKLRGTKVVTYHRSLSYLADWLGLVVVEHLEPRPGIPPSPRHVAHVIAVGQQQGVNFVLHESWYPTNTSSVAATKLGARLVTIPGMPDFQRGQSYIGFLDAVLQKLGGKVAP